MDSSIFDGAFTFLIGVGIIIGFCIVGIIKLLIWLFSHIQIEWIG